MTSLTHSRPNLAASLGQRSRERGFALVLSISILSLLLVYLIAAQTSLLGTVRQIANSKSDMGKSRMVDEALARAYLALGTTTQGTGHLQIKGSENHMLNVEYSHLAVGSDLYKSLPGIEGHRDGDALVVMTPEGDTAARQYLINIRGGRIGAIRVQ